MAAERRVKVDHILALRDYAISATMRHGRFEISGEARLLVLRDGSLMTAYRTPFNPLPRPTESMKLEAVLRGRHALREPYGIEIWDSRGRVFSAGWHGDAAPVVDCYHRGPWEGALALIARHELSPGGCRKCALASAARNKAAVSDWQGVLRIRKWA